MSVGGRCIGSEAKKELVALLIVSLGEVLCGFSCKTFRFTHRYRKRGCKDSNKKETPINAEELCEKKVCLPSLFSLVLISLRY